MSVGLQGYGQPWEWTDWDLAGYPYRALCRDWYTGIQCYTYMALFSAVGCAGRASTVTWNGPVSEPVGQPVDSTVVPNEGVVRGGLFTPTPLPVMPAGPDAPPLERPAGRFDQMRPSDGMDAMSIPPRATRKMKEDDARREAETSPARTFDRADVTTGKTEKPTTADASNRVSEPPPREPTKAKSTGEPRRETVRRTGFGSTSTGRTSEPRADRPDRVDMGTKSSGTTTSSPNPPTLQGTSTTEKKKPPQN
jgi:hypothetical protein